MSQQLISRNADLSSLRDEGYEVAIMGGHLVMSHVPYVTPARTIAYGTLISDLSLQGDDTVRPENHVAFFQGETPCDANGAPLDKLINSAVPVSITADLTATHMFSSKPPPPARYEDYYEKMTTYASILSSQAQVIDPAAVAQSYAPVADDGSDPVFHYLDTASSRAGISIATSKLALSRVAIIGLGGTGAYILDLLAKTPVKEIHLFDDDLFHSHNAFRSPGAPTIDQLRAHPTKVDYFRDQYSAMHRGVFAHSVPVNADNVDELGAMQFVFLAIDDGQAKAPIMDYLDSREIPFIDVGMGVYEVDTALAGIVRTTASGDTPASRDAARARISVGHGAENEYNRNIQIADLNAMNAALAVIKFKKIMGFYLDHEVSGFTAYTLDSNVLINEDAA